MKLSIITPSYNQGEFIADTFQSIIDQKIDFPLEYILIDAQSTDNTSLVVKKFKPLFKERGINFIYICEKDDGQSDAINKGFGLATGDILTYLNSDDFYESNTLHRVVKYFINNPTAQWAYGGWNLVNKEGKIYKSIQPTNYSYRKLLDYCNIGQPSCFFRKEALLEIGLLNKTLHLTMDYDLWLRLAIKSSACIMPFTIANMRYYAAAKSGSQTLQHLIQAFHLSALHSSKYSWQRVRQIFFFLRGFIIISLQKDITKRVSSLR